MAEYYKVDSDATTYRIIDNEAIILKLNTGEYYSLNETGTFIWKLLAGGISKETLIDEVAAEFRINKRRAVSDLKPLIRDLVSEEIIKKEK